MNTVEELFEAIEMLPDTIQYIRIPTSLDLFSAPFVTIEPNEINWRSEVKDTVAKVMTLPKSCEIDDFILKSFYGGNNPTDPYYIQFKSEASRKFAEDMGSGKHGSLD